MKPNNTDTAAKSATASAWALADFVNLSRRLESLAEKPKQASSTAMLLNKPSEVTKVSRALGCIDLGIYLAAIEAHLNQIFPFFKKPKDRSKFLAATKGAQA